jgi:hypothetical protein
LTGTAASTDVSEGHPSNDGILIADISGMAWNIWFNPVNLLTISSAILTWICMQSPNEKE